MKKTVILADSTCDLPKELIEKYGISILPLHVHLGEEEYTDGVDITPEKIYEWAEANNSVPKTSAVAIFEAKERLEKALLEGENAICFTISKEMSATYKVINMAVEELGVNDKVYVIDSMSLSTGIALQAAEAAGMAEQGIGAKEIVENIMKLQPLVRANFVVDTLKYLHLGGRCSSIAALAGGTLKLHPYIQVKDGKMEAGKKYHGKMEKVFANYFEDLRPELETAKNERIFITHSGCDERILASVKQKLEDMGHFKEIYIAMAGSVIASHCGPGTLGIIYIAGK